MGITEALYVSAALGLIALLHPGITRSTALAVHGTAQMVGIVIGGWFGGWMADQFGWRIGFFGLGVLGIAYACVLALVLRTPPAFRPEPKMVPSRPVDIFKSRCYVVIVLAFVAFGIMLWMLYAWLPNFIYERYHLSLGQSGLIGTLYLQSSSVVGLLTGGALADWLVNRVSTARFYIAGTGLLLSAPFAYLILAVHSLPLLKLFAAGFGLFAGFLLMNVFAAAYDVVEKHNYGFATGILNAFPGLASGTAIFLAGALKKSVGIVPLIGWAAVGAVCMAIMLLVTAATTFERDHRRAVG